MERSFGKYILLERLGGGGMAEVFRARLHGPQGFEKELALKLILPQLSDEPEFVKMFVHEATVAARLDHAAIVRIHEFDVVDGTYYIAMELVEGKDLRAAIAQAHQLGRNISVPEALFIALEVARGLAFAHGEMARGQTPIIHRDISPHNIIISRAGEVKITDFGIAKAASAASVTRTGVVKGKAAYMSPEQSRGEAVDTRSDLFSLGCVLWELLAGQRLFTGNNDFAILDKLQNYAVPPPSSFNPAVPADADRLVLKCLERDPQRRAQKASELVRELDRLLLATGADRTTLLADLFLDLFAEKPRGTQVLAAESAPAPCPSPPPAGQQDDAAATHIQASPATGPAGPDPCVATEIRPVGPDSQTELLAAGYAGRLPRRALRWVAGLASLAAVAAAWWLFLSPAAQPEENSSKSEAPGGLLAAAARSKLLWPAMPAPAPTPVAAAEPPSDKESVPVQEAGEEPAPAPEKPAGLTAAAPAEAGRKPTGAERPAAARGTIELNAMPWAKVYHRGRFLGVTPFRGRLPAGEQQLLLVNEELQVSRNVKVQITAGQLTRRLVDLKQADP